MEKPEIDKHVQDQIDLIMDFVNFTAQLQDLINQGYTESYVIDPLTGRQKRLRLLSTSN